MNSLDTLDEISQQLTALQASIGALQSQFTIYSNISQVNTDLTTLSTYFTQLSTAYSTYETILTGTQGGKTYDALTLNTYVTTMNNGTAVADMNLDTTTGSYVASNISCSVTGLLNIAAQMNTMISSSSASTSPGIYSPNNTLFNVMLKSYMLDDSFIYPATGSTTQTYAYSTVMNSIESIYSQYSALFYEIMNENYMAITLMSEVMSYCNNLIYPGYFQNPGSFSATDQQQVQEYFDLFTPQVYVYLQNETAEFWRGVEAIRLLTPTFWHDSPNSASPGTGTTLSSSDYRTNAYALAFTMLGQAPVVVMELQIPYSSTTSYSGSAFQTNVPAYLMSGTFSPWSGTAGSAESLTATDLFNGSFTSQSVDYFVAPTMNISVQKNTSNSPPLEVIVTYNLNPDNNSLQWPTNSYVPHAAFVASIADSLSTTSPTVTVSSTNTISNFYTSTPFTSSPTYNLNLSSDGTALSTTVVTTTDPNLWGSYLLFGISSASLSVDLTKVSNQVFESLSSSVTVPIGFDMSDKSSSSTYILEAQVTTSTQSTATQSIMSNYLDDSGGIVIKLYQIVENLTAQQMESSSALPAETNGNVNVGFPPSLILISTIYSGFIQVGEGTSSSLSAELPLTQLYTSYYTGSTFQSPVTTSISTGDMSFTVTGTMYVSDPGMPTITTTYTSNVTTNMTLNISASLL